MAITIAPPPDIAEALESFDKAADEILRPFCEALEALPLPPLIYHYTDAAGLKGILSGGRLWLTDAFQLNDPSELRHGLSIMNELLQKRVVGGPPPASVFAAEMTHFEEHGGLAAAAHYFVGSLTTAGDDLNQWTRYADNGRGFALTFDTEALEAGFTRLDGQPIPNCMTFPAAYDDAKLAGLHGELIDLVLPLFELPGLGKMTREQATQFMRELSVFFTVHAIQAILFFKHEAYRTEAEYRFMQLFRADRPPPAVLTRRRGEDCVRYREFDWRSVAPGALKSIIVGPAAPADAASDARAWLDGCGLTAVEVRASKLPYRVNY